MPNQTGKSASAYRKDWETAVGTGSARDALVALEALERREPNDARWPHRVGDAYRRLGRLAQAAGAYRRAMVLYEEAGFTARAVAMEKLVDVMAPPPHTVIPSFAPPSSRPAPRHGVSSIPPASAVKIVARARHGEPSLFAGLPIGGFRAVVDAEPLLRADDAGDDEVRFDDAAPESRRVDIEIGEVDPESWLPEDLDAQRSLDFVETPTAARLSLVSGSPLFADLPREVVPDLARAADLVELAAGGLVYRAGSPADSLYLVVGGVVAESQGSGSDAEGTEIVAGIEAGTRGEGEVFGEECLLEASVRATDVRAKTPLMALRIPKTRLDRIVRAHAVVGDALFATLVNRLVSSFVQTSGLFTELEVEARRGLASLFEVRRAAPQTVLAEAGKRSDGVYVLLSGRVETFEEGCPADGAPLPLGSALGQRSLLGHGVEVETARVVSEAVVLRLPSWRFSELSARFKPAVAHLASL